MSSISLQSDCSVQVLESALTPPEYSEFIRIGTKNAYLLMQPTSNTYGHRPKFKDVTFDFGESGIPNRGYAHTAITEEIYDMAKIIKDRYNAAHPQNPYERLFNCNLVHYTPKFDLGGGRGRHQDNPTKDLGLVLIYSWGQARTLNIYDHERLLHKIPMSHNSIIAMQGQNFQKKYFHSVPKLHPSTPPTDRHSFNIRYFT